MSYIMDTPEQVAALCDELNKATQLKKSGRSIKTTNTVFNTDISIDSWRFMDWDYGKDSVKLPIQARGLFTRDDKIVVRGYDKFFNVDEKKFTKVEELKRNTTGPYDVTLKENGCIVFISGLSSGEIIVCSKHSTGEKESITRNHALESERQLRVQLGGDEEKVRELAQYLYRENLTAVAELCDDEFEEHVLSYSKDNSGLYLHGLNYNTIKFQTVAIDKVQEFADEWNFKKIEYLTFDDVDKLFEFLDKCSETGKYQDREVEGFVIRCKSNNEDFFFKYKFEQPYLLYRQFREVTKQLIENIPMPAIRIKKNKFITKKYLEFVSDLFQTDPTLKQEFNDGHGIIKVRELFLQNLHETNGMNLLTLDEHLSHELDNLNLENKVKYVVVPIATIGCGKTTVFHTLASLFNWVHIQNDNIPKRSKLKIVDFTLMSLYDNDVVLFDRNNSEYRERKQIFTTIDQKRSEYLDGDCQIKFIALNFVNDIDQDQLWQITFDRIKKRGDNHQSIKSNSDETLATNVMKSFMYRFQPLDTSREPDSLFDHVINLKLSENSSIENIELIIEDLSKTYPELIKRKPSIKQLLLKFTDALNYSPGYTKNMSSEAKQVKPAYYGISIDHPTIINVLKNKLGTSEPWELLQRSNRVQSEFHVTLSHSSNAKGNKSKWKEIVKKFGTGTDIGQSNLDYYSDLKLTQIIICPKLICLKVDLINTVDSEGDSVELDYLNPMLHITVGTFKPEVRPVESGVILQKLYAEDENLKPDGEYQVDDQLVRVVNFNEEVILEKQRLFVFK
ncbi:tRNA ligase [Spathaspora sp. JA1]|nr:tRNA ligase [Spathaspora sp. JA1]